MVRKLFIVISLLQFCSFNSHALSKFDDLVSDEKNPTYNTAKDQRVKSLGWGGGGAFTGVTELNGNVFLSSDVAGIWLQDKAKGWTPFVDGLNDYNISGIINFHNKIYAVTSSEILTSNGHDAWQSTGIKLKTYRGSHVTLFAKDQNEKFLCIASLDGKIVCFDDNHQSTTYTLSSAKIHGLSFDHSMLNTIYYYAGKTLFELNLTNKKVNKIHEFGKNIVGITALNGGTYIATQNTIYNLNNIKVGLIDVSPKLIVNVFTFEGIDKSKKLMANIGDKWNAKLYEMDVMANAITKKTRIKTKLQTSLPHRNIQKSLTKYLSINKSNGTVWVTDYWGAYKLDYQDSMTLNEITYDAINIVATDFLVEDEEVFISSMDNGLIKLTFADNTLNKLIDIRPLSQNLKRGHSWSVERVGDAIYSNISAWNDPNDYLFKYTRQNSVVYPVTDYDSRKSKKTFWDKSYARKLVYMDRFYSFRDGDNGGLIEFDVNDTASILTHRITADRYNRVYRGLSQWNDSLYFADCSAISKLYKFKPGMEKSIAANLPQSFCTFEIFSSENALFLLGTDKYGPVIYEFSHNILKKYFASKKGSAFFAMAVNPNNSDQVLTATTTWSTKPTSSIFASANSGLSFIDKGCLLSHKNGVVSIKFSDDGQFVYILQKVGGLLVLPTTQLFETNCG